MEFSLDSVATLQHKGFSVEPSRGVVERGQTKTITISWVPPADFDVGARGLRPRALPHPAAEGAAAGRGPAG